MSITVSVDTWLVVSLVIIFVALRVYHPVTSLIKKRKKQ